MNFQKFCSHRNPWCHASKVNRCKKPAMASPREEVLPNDSTLIWRDSSLAWIHGMPDSKISISGFLPSLTQPENRPSRFSGHSSYRFLAPWGPQNLLQNAQECFVVSSIWLYLTLSISILSPPSLTVSQAGPVSSATQVPGNFRPRTFLVDTENHGYGYTSNNSGQIIIIHKPEIRPFGDDFPY